MADDDAIAHYWSLRPPDFPHLMQVSLTRPLSPEAETILRLTLYPASGLASRALVLTFFGVHDLHVMQQDFSASHINIVSIRDRGWERLNYIVDEEEGAIRFCCHHFDSRVADLESSAEM